MSGIAHIGSFATDVGNNVSAAWNTGTDGREGGVTGEPEPDERKEDVFRADVETALKCFTELENLS